MVILLNIVGDENAPWVEVMQRALPHFEVLEPAQISQPEDVRYAVIWHHPHNDLQRYPNLQAILNLGAGTDHLDQDPALRKIDNIPVVRLLDPDVGIDMAQYTLYWAMHFQRGYEQYRQQSEQRDWQRHIWPRACDWRVTVLGLGRIGRFIAEKVQQMGFVTQAWNRSEQNLDCIQGFFGYDNLNTALSETNLVVNCLPSNSQTNGLLNAERFEAMPPGGYLISISRGAVIEEQALIAQLESGHLAGAALDCFAEEPLASESPLWAMPNVHITPHMSGATFARSAGLVVVENIQRMERGEAPFPIHAMTTNKV